MDAKSPERRLICGVDEAGRGPIAGPVYAAAVILDAARPIDGLRDSKQLSARRREQLSDAIRTRSLAWSIGTASVVEIDRLNILRATLLAMQRAVALLDIAPGEIWVDGNRTPEFDRPARAIVGGDRLHAPICAASIIAKTARDAEMRRLDALYPQYGLARHKGYPTREHVALLVRHGVCEIYRRSFAPVQALIAASSNLASLEGATSGRSLRIRSRNPS
ncbi:MAG: ribonuclease HII [Betaproteobacteria bacterium]|nr:ribonuclease HII [Betaproteobacteria bacterium]